jgi:hypothetical protein
MAEAVEQSWKQATDLNGYHVANAILFFTSPASGFMTGQTVSVSGGLTMHG